MAARISVTTDTLMSSIEPNSNQKAFADASPLIVDDTGSTTHDTSEKWHITLAIIVFLCLLVVVAFLSWYFFLFRGRGAGESSPSITHQSLGLSEPTNIRRLVMCHYCSNYCKRGVPCPHCGVYGVGMAACHKCLLFGKKGNACVSCGTVIKTPTFCKPHCDVFGCGGDNFKKMMGTLR